MPVLKILGACSGTEPIEGLHHSSLVLIANDRNYFFDAGENCSHTAHVSGTDLLKTRAVFISHLHYDHIGGLMGLFWTVNKINSYYKTPVADKEIKLFIPEVRAWNNIYETLKYTEGGFKHSFGISVGTTRVGPLFDDGCIKVTAFETHHLPKGEDGLPRSFSYLIEFDGKRMVYSGDFKDMEELSPPVGVGCDVLICETGHHSVEEVCGFAQTRNVKRLILTHHGREILQHRPTVESAVRACRIPVDIAFDGMTLML